MDGKLTYAAHVPEGDGPFPAVILLHGWGANAHDLLGFAPFLHGGNALVLCPQGPVSLPIGYGMRGYGWYPPVPWRKASGSAGWPGCGSSTTSSRPAFLCPAASATCR